MGKLARFKGEEFDCVVVDPATMEEVGRVRAFVAKAEDNVGYTLKLLESTPMYPEVLKVNVDDPDDFLYCGNYTHRDKERQRVCTSQASIFLANIIRTGELKVPGMLGSVDSLFTFNGWEVLDDSRFPWGGGGGISCAF